MEDNTALTVAIVLLTLLALTGLALLIFFGLKKYKSKAELKVEPILRRLELINGNESTHYVDLYLIYGLFESHERIVRIYLSSGNVEEVHLLAKGLKEFCWRWGIISHGAIYVPFIIWWNYRKVFKKIVLFRNGVLA